MTDKVIIEELCCRECPENEIKRCSEQKEKYRNSINYILSFIENDENKEHITELKKRIVEPTRCDVVLEKRLQRLKAENEELKTKIFDEGLRRKTCKYYKQVCSENTQLIAYRNALEEVREITEKYYLPDKKLLATGIEINPYGAIIEIQDKINEVLGD